MTSSFRPSPLAPPAGYASGKGTKEEQHLSVPNLPRWELRADPSTPETVRDFARTLDISPLIARILFQRGMTDVSEMDVFLSPGLRHLPPLEEWPGLEAAAQCIAQEIGRGAPLAVWGDYDVDGVTATALLADFFEARGIACLTHLPSREKEGYGLNVAGIDHLADQGIRLLITVDCGISGMAPVERARERGMTVVITDHHLPGEELPRAAALLNPKMGSTCYADCAGVGVSFLLAAALNRLLPGQSVDIRSFLDLVALGTLADVVPVTGRNRILVKNGLLLLARGDRPGIRALKQTASIPADKPLGSGDVLFGLAPRINAAGRLSRPRVALDLLRARDFTSALKLAGELESFNSQRKTLEESATREALQLAREQNDAWGLVLAAPDWHPGVIGIVASRVTEETHKPCLLLTHKDGMLQGSGRSISGFDLYAALDALAPLLARFGGHRMAVGLACRPDLFQDLRRGFDHIARERMGPERPRLVVRLDALLPFADITPTLIQELDMLQPFGPGNPRPLFLSPPLGVRTQRFFGQGKHLGMELSDEISGVTLRSTLWRQGERLKHSSLPGKTLRVAFTPRLNTFNGLTSLEVTVNHLLEIA